MLEPNVAETVAESKSAWDVKHVDFVKSAALAKQMPDDGIGQVAFAGRSNVGKSSLLNLLVNRKKLAVVSSMPGRTRLVNFFAVNRGECYFVDLPGYGFAKASKAMQGAWRGLMDNYLQGNAAIRACVTLFDIRREGLTAEDEALLGWLHYYGVSIIAVLTKADKLSRSQQAQARRKLGLSLAAYEPAAIVCSSSSSRQGREELLGEIARACFATETTVGDDATES